MAKTTTVEILTEDLEVINSIKNQLCVREHKKQYNWDALHLIIQEWRQSRKEAK